MTKKSGKIREALKNLLYSTPCGEEFDNKMVDQALKQIEELLPKEWKKTEFYSVDKYERLVEYGFNECLRQVKELMK